MYWIDVNDRLPEKEGKIFVLIGESIFCIDVYVRESGCGYINLDKFYCSINKSYKQIHDDNYNYIRTEISYKTEFKKPSYYKDVTHWCEVPQFPKKNEETGWVRKGNENEEFYQRFGGSGKIHIKENKDA